MRFKTVRGNFTTIPNEVIQGFYLSANALAVLVTCLSYPDNWDYRPLHIWKHLGIGRDKTYSVFEELIEKGHCIRIRSLRGNLRSHVDYIFFDQRRSCLEYIEQNEKEFSSPTVQVDHVLNFKKSFRHPDCQESEGQVPDSQEVLKKNETQKIRSQKIKESKPAYQKFVPPKPKRSTDFEPSNVPPPASAAQASIPSHGRSEEEKDLDFLSAEALEIADMEPQTKPYFRPQVIAAWVHKWGPKMTLDLIKYFFKTISSQKRPIDKPEAWMEDGFKKQYAKTAQIIEKNKEFAETIKRKYRILHLKINKRYCQDIKTRQDYYYSLPVETFQKALQRLCDEIQDESKI